MPMTTTQDLINPEILAPIIQNKYQNAMMFMPLAAVDRTLEGQPGDTLKQPIWKKIAAAQPIAEGANIPTQKAEQGFTTATVQKFGNGYSFTDESNIERIGDQVSYGTSEIARTIAEYGDNALMKEAQRVTNTLTIDPTVLGIDSVVAWFNAQNNNGAYTIILNPKTKIAFDKSILDYTRGSELGANLVVNGAVPGPMGVSFRTTNAMEDGKAVVIYSSADDIKFLEELHNAQQNDPAKAKEIATTNTGQALKWLVKRDLLVESERKPGNQTNYIYGTQIAAPYVQNPSKVLNLKVNMSTTTPTASSN